jgi:chromosome segregation ATPase
MPELYGQPYKWELRKEIAELRRENWNHLKEKLRLRSQLDFSRCKIAELESQLAKIKSALGSIASDIDQDIGPAVMERYKNQYNV